jgi:hypothetical protein
MDPLEKKVRAFYQEKKREDEKSIPGFETFRTDAEIPKSIKKPVLIWKIAASVAAIAIIAVFIYRSRNDSKPADNIAKMNPMNMNDSLPTHSLNDQSLSVTYIWQWKASTDKLLEDAKESIKINSN